MPVYKIEDSSYKNVLTSPLVPCFVKFGSDGCHLCMALKRPFRELSSEYGEEVLFLAVDVDENPELKEQYVTDGIPALYIFFAGNAYLVPEPEESHPSSWYSKKYMKEQLDKGIQGDCETWTAHTI